MLLGAIIEEVTGRGYHDALDRLVFRPAGMATAGPSGGPQAARRYTHADQRLVSVDSLYPDVRSPAGGGFAAASDLQRFVGAVLDGVLLDPRHVALLLNDFEPPPTEWTPSGRIAFAGGARGLKAALLAHPQTRDLVVVLANMDPPTATAVADQAETMLP